MDAGPDFTVTPFENGLRRDGLTEDAVTGKVLSVEPCEGAKPIKYEVVMQMQASKR